MALLATLPNGERQNNVGKKKDGSVTTWRFDLALEEPTDDKTNEFSYIHLVHDAMKKRDTPPVEDDGPVDSKLLRIAKELEEKYGSAVKKRRIVHDADYVDLGYGYDTSDSFVDDADAVDDFVPPEMDTEFGGFYINTGDLEYKRSKDTEIDDFEFAKKKKKQPKIARQPSHGTPQTVWANKKLKLAKQQVASAKKLKLPVLMRKTSSDSSKGSTTPVLKGERKRRPKSDKEGVKKPRQQPQQSLLAQLAAVAPSNSDQPGVSIGRSTPVFGSQLSETSASPPLGSGDSPSNIDNVRVDDVGGSVEVFGSPVAVGGDAGTPLGGVVKGPPPPLPPGLPADLTKMIEELTSAVSKETSGDKKMSQKTRMGFDTQLMEVEKVASKFVNNKTRLGINDHLAAVFGVSRSSLTSRTRKLIKKREEDKMAIAMDKLKQAVDERMKVQLKRYEEELAAAASAGGAGTSDGAASSAGGGSGGSESEVMETDTVEKGAGSSAVLSGGDDESQGGSGPQAPGGGAGQQVQQKAKKVRKHFKWDAEVKQLLVAVVKVKIEREQVVLQKGINVESMLMQFLEETVKPLWPKGWMFKGILMRASEPAYKYLLPQKDAGLKPIAQLQVSTGAGAISSPVNVVQPPETLAQVPKTVAQQAQVLSTVPQPTTVAQDPKIVAQLDSVATASPVSKSEGTHVPQYLHPSSAKVPALGQGTPPEQQKDSQPSLLNQVVASSGPSPVKAVSHTIVLPGGIKLDLTPTIQWAKLVAQPQTTSTSRADTLPTSAVIPRSSTPSTPGTQAQSVIVHGVKSKSGSPPQQVGGAASQQVGGATAQQVGGVSTQQVGGAAAPKVGGAAAQQIGGVPTQQVDKAAAPKVGGAAAQQVGGVPTQQVVRAAAQKVGGAAAQQVGGVPTQQVVRAAAQKVGGAAAQQVGGVPTQQVVREAAQGSKVLVQQLGGATKPQVGVSVAQQVGVAPTQQVGVDSAPAPVRRLTPLPITGGAPMRGAVTQRQKMTPTQQGGGAPVQQVGGSPAQQVGGAQAQQVGGAKSASNLNLILEKIVMLKTALSPTACTQSLVLPSNDTTSTTAPFIQETTASHFSALHPVASTSRSVSIATTVSTSPMATQIMAEHSYQGSPTSLTPTATAEGESAGTVLSSSTVQQSLHPPWSQSPAPQKPFS